MVSKHLFSVVAFLGLLAAPANGLTHYAPANTSNTNLNTVLNSMGAPGIFNSSYTPNEQYGEYNWCNMPHVRKTEYKVPDQSYELQYVEIIQRHHKRTPYASNTFFKEDITWNCTGQGPFAYSKAVDFKTTPVYWQAQTVGPGFAGSTCQFPAITTEGLDDALQHGKDVYGVYGDLLQFLPLAHEYEKYAWRVTNNVITSQTLSGFAKGVFPDIEEYSARVAVPISPLGFEKADRDSQSAAYDSLEPKYACPTADAIRDKYEGSNADWVAHLNQSAALRDRFNAVSGIDKNDTAGWKTSWDHPYDNLSAKQCHGLPLPCSVNASTTCVSQQDAESIYRLGNYEYSYRYRMAQNSTLYSVLKMGGWLKELQGHVQDSIDGKSPVKYQHNFAHDGSIAPLLGALQIDEPVWPGMGSEVVFELWKKDNASYIRVLWRGQPLKTSTPLGTLDLVKWTDFNGYLNDLIPSDLRAACNA